MRCLIGLGLGSEAAETLHKSTVFPASLAGALPSVTTRQFLFLVSACSQYRLATSNGPWHKFNFPVQLVKQAIQECLGILLLATHFCLFQSEQPILRRPPLS